MGAFTPTPDPRSLTPDFHAIRLRGPWDYEVLSGEGLAAGCLPTGRVTMPTDWGASLGGDFLGRVRYVRRFNQPSGIKPAVRVWLVFDGADARADVTLNDRPLGRVEGASRAEFDVTALLRQHNVVTAVVEKGPADDRGDRVHLPGGLVGEVRLEFRGPDAGWLDRAKMAERDRE